MEREVLMEDLKKLYSSSDMVKADCGGCKGCHDCCCGMGDSIVLDPYDIYQMNKHLGVKFEELLNHKISLHVDVPFMLFALVFVVCFRLAEFMRTVLFLITCSHRNVPKQIVQK